MTRRRRWIALVAMLVAAAIGLGGLAVVRLSSEPAGPSCPPVADHPGWTVARRWNEAALNAIRRALPAPTVHARNLFHLSVAMWDAWAAYDAAAVGYLVTEKHTTPDVAAARNEAISYAAYRLLSSRHIDSIGADESLSEVSDLMDALCYPLDVTTTAGDSPAALGNRIAETVIAYGISDGSNEADGYTDPDYEPVNPPLVVAEPGTTMTDPDRWQPLRLESMISQNGIPVRNGVQRFVGPHWGHVKSFALPEARRVGVPIDPGPQPRLRDIASSERYQDEAVEVIRLTSQLDPSDGVTVDISPGVRGANPLGTNDGRGHPLNPATGVPYEPNVVLRGDYVRALVETWADGPKSETPPGHWNVIANEVSDELAPDLRIGGTGQAVDRLEWDVKLYFALNGAEHDAAVAAWGLKGFYDSARPISMVRYLAGLGQSTDPSLPSYDPRGLPLVPDLIELVTDETTAADERHAHLAGHEGEIAIRGWAGPLGDGKAERSGVTWILAAEWVPYQLPTFVTPSFAGYPSGHSTFSRAAAEVMASFTGSEYLPGGIDEWTVEAGSLEVDAGPSRDVTLQWATYHDAADLAGISRLYGGIHVPADDFTGRRIGSDCGKAAWAVAQRYFDGRGAA